jgi:hypothetical protein
MGSAHVKWMPQFRGSALRLIAVCLVVVAVITGAVSLTVWKHEAANQRTDDAIAAFRDELLTGQLVGLFWHEREAMRQELLTPSPAAQQEIRTVAAQFSATVASFGQAAPEARLGGQAAAANRAYLVLFTRIQPSAGMTRPGLVSANRRLDAAAPGVQAPLTVLWNTLARQQAQALGTIRSARS